jgi:thiol-disulfide isomerase/thioredoxin
MAAVLLASLLIPAWLPMGRAAADDPKQTDQGATEPDTPAEFVLSDEVRDALMPLFTSIRQADVSRANVRLSADSLINGAVVDSQESTYQIASAAPDKFTIYLKEPEQRTRIFCDGKSAAVAMAPDAYFRIAEPLDLQQAVTKLPVPLGPYPEAVLALSLAGVDPSLSFLTAMKSVEIVDRGKFRGKVPAIHFRGVQDDAVAWDLWITQDQAPKPLRLSVDLTEMLRANNQVQLGEGFSFLLRFDFLSWRLTGEVDHKLFQYTPPRGAIEYESLDDYYESIAGAIADHPLLGKPAPPFAGKSLTDQDISSDQYKNKVVVLDFWATWCVPCSSAIPVLQEVTDKFADKDVVLIAVNVGEPAAKIKGFLSEQDWQLNVLVDQDTKVSAAFGAEAIPLTMVIGKSGVVESVHVGFAGPQALTKRLTDELEVLTAGGRIASSAEPSE